MKQKVVVIGHGYTSRLGVIRALGREGYEVIVVVITGYNKDGVTLDTTKPIDCYSKYVSKIYYCQSEKEKLIRLLLKECVDKDHKVVLFADSDFAAASIDENKERLRAYFLFPHIDSDDETVVAWMDKVRQKELAIKTGLNVAEGWLIEIKDGKYVIPADLRYPCFPKPLLTIEGGKDGLRRCDNELQLRNMMELFMKRSLNITVLAEEFKKIDTEHALMGFSDGKEVIIPGIIKTTSLSNGGHFGVAKQGLIQPVCGYEELVEKFKQYVLKTHFVGIFDIDFFKSEGSYYFCEMNLRYGGSGYAYTAMGVNLPVMMTRVLLGQSIIAMQQEVSKEAVFVNERMLRDDWYANYISTYSFRNMLKTANISFVADKQDKGPQREYYKTVMNPKILIKRLIKGILGRR